MKKRNLYKIYHTLDLLKKLCLIVIINDFLLLNSRLLLDFWAKTIDTMNYLQNKLLIKNLKKEFIQKKLIVAKYKILIILEFLKVLFVLKFLKKNKINLIFTKPKIRFLLDIIQIL